MRFRSERESGTAFANPGMVITESIAGVVASAILQPLPRAPLKTWKSALKDGLVVGGIAGLASLAALALGGRAERGSPWGPVNAPSHWLWGDPALHQDGATPRYTATGLVVHQLAASFWGVLHEFFLGASGEAKGPALLLRDAALTTAVAAVVDLRVVPHRLTPGFQRRLSAGSLGVVYVLFGLGLAVGSHVSGRRRGR